MPDWSKHRQRLSEQLAADLYRVHGTVTREFLHMQAQTQYVCPVCKARPGLSCRRWIIHTPHKERVCLAILRYGAPSE